MEIVTVISSISFGCFEYKLRAIGAMLCLLKVWIVIKHLCWVPIEWFLTISWKVFHDM